MENENLETKVESNTTTNQKKNGNKGLIICLILIILSMGGYITYDKVLKDKYFSKDSDKTKEVEKDKEEAKNEGKISIEQKYSNYIENLKKNINTLYDNSNNYSREEFSGYEQQSGYYINVNLTNNGTITVKYAEDEVFNTNVEEIKNVDNNVLQLFSPVNSKWNFFSIYYLKNDLKVYKLDLSSLEEKNIEIKEVNGLDNIIGAIPTKVDGPSYMYEEIFIDIEGNLFKLENNKVIKVN